MRNRRKARCRQSIFSARVVMANIPSDNDVKDAFKSAAEKYLKKGDLVKLKEAPLPFGLGWEITYRSGDYQSKKIMGVDNINMAVNLESYIDLVLAEAMRDVTVR